MPLKKERKNRKIKLEKKGAKLPFFMLQKQLTTAPYMTCILSGFVMRPRKLGILLVLTVIGKPMCYSRLYQAVCRRVCVVDTLQTDT